MINRMQRLCVFGKLSKRVGPLSKKKITNNVKTCSLEEPANCKQVPETSMHTMSFPRASDEDLILRNIDKVVKGVVESLKIITRKASMRVAEYAFLYAKTNGRKKVSAIHKANIMQKTDGLFLQVVKGVVESLKIITRKASMRVAEYAFLYAKTNGRKKVSAIHKANIMQKTDGLFLQTTALIVLP